MGSWKSEALCLQAREYGETSVIATFLTRDRGRIAAIAKGARRPASRFFGAIEPLTRCELVGFARKRSELHTLAEVEVVDVYREARRDLVRLHAALYVVEVLREGTREQAAPPDLYATATRALERIARNRIFNPLTVIIFELRALAALGFAPRLDACAECGNPEASLTAFAPIQGGAACEACAASDRDRRSLTEEALAALRLLADAPERARALAPSGNLVRELRGHLDASIAARLERRLRLAPHLAMPAMSDDKPHTER